MSNCHVDASGCVVCIAVPSTPPTQPQQSFAPMLGWNAGADSDDTIDGDLHVVFTQDAVVGALNGLKQARRGVGVPQLLDFAFGFHQFQGVPYFYVVERGQQKTNDAVYTAGDTFEVRRTGPFIQYYYTAAGVSPRLIHLSQHTSIGPLVTSACLFSSGDTTG